MIRDSVDINVVIIMRVISRRRYRDKYIVPNWGTKGWQNCIKCSYGIGMWCPLSRKLGGLASIVNSPSGVQAEPRPEAHYGIFWRQQNVLFCLYMLMLWDRQMWYLGARPRFGATAPMTQRRTTPIHVMSHLGARSRFGGGQLPAWPNIEFTKQCFMSYRGVKAEVWEGAVAPPPFPTLLQCITTLFTIDVCNRCALCCDVV